MPLASDEYGLNWAQYWRDVIFLRATNEFARVAIPSFENWMTAQLQQNVGWHEIARSLITGVGDIYEHGEAAFVFAHQGNADEIAGNTRRVVEQAREALDSLQSKNGPVQGVTSSMKQTLDDTRAAMAGFAENMEALKHNFLFRGFFNKRGYFDLAQISPAEYRKGMLSARGARVPVRVWLSSAVLFESDPDTHTERLTAVGKERLESAIAPFLDRIAQAVAIVEGYSRLPTRDQQYVQSRTRASLAREHLIGKFDLDASAVGVMPLGVDSPDSPDGKPWDGIALAVFMEKE